METFYRGKTLRGDKPLPATEALCGADPRRPELMPLKLLHEAELDPHLDPSSRGPGRTFHNSRSIIISSHCCSIHTYPEKKKKRLLLIIENQQLLAQLSSAQRVSEKFARQQAWIFIKPLG